jgi:hypothetical protein
MLKSPIYTIVEDLDEMDALMWELCQKEKNHHLVIISPRKVRTINFTKPNKISGGLTYKLCKYLTPLGIKPDRDNPILGSHLVYLVYLDTENLIEKIRGEIEEELLDSISWVRVK